MAVPTQNGNAFDLETLPLTLSCATRPPPPANHANRPVEQYLLAFFCPQDLLEQPWDLHWNVQTEENG
jgi:hypothetical protein